MQEHWEQVPMQFRNLACNSCCSLKENLHAGSFVSACILSVCIHLQACLVDSQYFCCWDSISAKRKFTNFSHDSGGSKFIRSRMQFWSLLILFPCSSEISHAIHAAEKKSFVPACIQSVCIHQHECPACIQFCPSLH